MLIVFHVDAVADGDDVLAEAIGLDQVSRVGRGGDDHVRAFIHLL